MTESDLVYSAKVATRAARFYCWRRLCTSLGFLHLGSLLLFIGVMVFFYKQNGADWFFGFMGTLVGMNVIFLLTASFTYPWAVARSISTLKSLRGHIAVNDEGVTLSLDGNVAKLPWSRFWYVWPREDFIILARPLFSMLIIPTEGMDQNVRAEIERLGLKAVGA